MIYNYKTFPSRLVSDLPTAKRSRGNQGTRERRVYVGAVCAFDIETTRLDEDHSILYIWQLQIGPDLTIVGRSWREFIYCLRRLKRLRPDGERFVIWVHNLSFEFQFLRGIYNFQPAEVFLTDARKPLRADMMDAFEFRCSYRHSNASLDQFLKMMQVPVQKLTMDYSVKRYPWTPLTDEELAYCVADVQGLVQAITKEMEMDKTNLYNIPLTSTGFVRKDAKAALKHTPPGYIREMLPDMPRYMMMRTAFRGGDTHASRFYAGRILEGVKSYDRSSSYPDVMINCQFPITYFWPVDRPDLDRVADLMNRKGKALLLTVRLWGLRMTDDLWGFPYLSIDKCKVRNPRWMEETGLCYDNGRILRADYLETTITDVDLRIILEEYDFDDIEITKAYAARYGPLPPALKALIIADYREKTRLKGVTGEINGIPAEVYYARRKVRINSYYGMLAQNVITPQYILKDGEYILDPDNDPRKQIEDYQNRGWRPYQWGLWTTSHARMRLREGLRLAGHGAVYCDTDSVKYIGDVDWTAYNEKRRKDSEASGAWADDPAGVRHYMGVYEEDGEYLEFATLGAKKYAYRTPDGVLHATISGVNKKLGGKELEAAGGLSAFLTPGFTFKEAGGRELRYLDKEDTPIWIDGHKVRRRPCVTINDSTYTLGITEDYDKLLCQEEVFGDFLQGKYGKI